MEAATPLIWHLEKLPYFLAIADTGSFRKASVRLRLSQPSLSRAIATLEEACGVRLFDRQKTGATLTLEGRILQDTARSILRAASKAASEFSRVPDERPLALVTHELLVPLLAPALAGLAAKGLSVRVETSPSVRALLDRIEDYDADAGIVASSPPRKAMHLELLFSDSFRFFCKPSQKGSFQGLAAKDLPLILAPNVLAGAGESLAEHLRRIGLELRPKHTVGSIESVAALTAAGLGVGLLPAKVGQLLQPGKLAELSVLPRTAPALGSHGFFFACREETWKKDRVTRTLFERIKDLAPT